MLYPDNYLEVCEKANECRRNWNINENSPIDIFSIVLNKYDNMTIVFLDMDLHISGSSCNVANQKIVFINSNHPLGRQRFTLAHELYHLEYEDTFVSCGLSDNSEVEEIANQFASCLLMSNGALLNYERENNVEKWDLDHIIQAEQYFQISHKAMLRRLCKLDKITKSEYDSYLPNIMMNAKKRGYTLHLYQSFTENNLVMGNYIKLTQEAYKNNKISKGKKDELLMDAFCSNLVYKNELDDSIG